MVVQDGFDFTVGFREAVWAISRDRGRVGVADYVDRHLRRELGKEAQGVFPKVLLPPVRSMYIEDSHGVSLVLYGDYLETAVCESLVLLFETYW